MFKAMAATVSCNFIEGDVFDTEFGWVSEPSQESIMQLFTNELRIELDNSLLEQLDTQEPFFVAEHGLGKIFIRGSDIGVEGRMISVNGNRVTVWTGFCQVSFG